MKAMMTSAIVIGIILLVWILLGGTSQPAAPSPEFHGPAGTPYTKGPSGPPPSK